jgi:hypothetical protein
MASRVPASLTILLCGVVIALFSGCAQFALPSIATGTTASEVRARVGTPTDERSIAGRKAWDFVQGPQGFTTWRVSFDGADRVASVEQILTERRIQNIEAGTHSREDVANLLGRPAEITQFRMKGEDVWTYRFLDVQERKLGDVHFDSASGRTKFTITYPDPAYVNATDF